MSNLEGNLTPAAILEVLEILISRNPAATWVISDGQGEKVIYFSTGGIRLYSSDERRIASLEGYLSEKVGIAREELELARETAREGRKETIDEVLERKGLLNRAQYLEAVSELIFLEVSDLAVWENAIHEFYEGNPPPEIFDSSHPAIFASINVKTLCARVKEWCQEWGTIKGKVYSERLRPRPTGKAEDLSAWIPSAPWGQRLAKLFDGQRNLRELSRLSGAGFPSLARLVRDGLKDGYLRATLIAEKEAASETDVLTEIESLEEALDKAINTILIHKRIAGGYEKLGDLDQASTHYQSVADIHSAQGRLPKAIENYRKAITLSPQNLEAHETLIRRLQDHGLEEQAHGEILGFSRKLVSFGLLDRALGALKSIRAKAGVLSEVRLLLVDVLAGLGKIPEAVAECLGLARERVRAGQVEGIEEIYRKALALDPTNQEARAALAAERARRSGKVRVWGNRISMAAGILAIAFLGGGEILARLSLRKAEAAIREEAGSGKPEGFEKIRALGRSYPLTFIQGSLLALERGLFQSAFQRLEEELARAEALRSAGQMPEAGRAYEGVARVAISPAQAARAARGQREADAATEEARDLRRNAGLYLDARFYEDAFQSCRKLLDRHPEQTAGIKIPFFIRTDPPGAEVRLHGASCGSTPLWVTVPLDSLPTLRIEKAGFRPESVSDLRARRTPFVSVMLSRAARGN